MALLFTLLNSFKPLQIDDAAYYYYAAQIAEHPLDPYDFKVFWYQWPEPANHVLAPPVLPYWWAGAICLFGDRPFLWKMWLLPFSLIFVCALARLFRSFTPGFEKPLVWMTVFSPTFLPSLNLMLDVPALALGLFSITVFLDACNRLDLLRAMVAGFLAGLAMQTKYTGFLAPATMILYGFLFAWLAPSMNRRSKAALACFSLVAVLVALNVFAGWELFIAFRHGESHFYHEFQQNQRDILVQVQNWSLPLLSLFGGAAPGIVLLGWLALSRCWLPFLSAAMLVIAGYCVVAFANPFRWTVDFTRLSLPNTWTVRVTGWEQLIFPSFGIVGVVVFLGIAWRLLRIGQRGFWQPQSWSRHRVDWFLLLWLALEIGGYFAMTPFGAVRRIMGIVVVSTLVAGRLASFTCRWGTRRNLVWSIAVANSLLGLVFLGVDFLDARASQRMAESASAYIRQQDSRAHIWYVGHWGFQFYAEHSGMQPVVPDSLAAPLHPGDWLVVPNPRINQQLIGIDSEKLERVTEQAVNDVVPLRTVQCFYGTATGEPLEHLEGSRCWVTIYRVTQELIPATPR
ncbi:MAG TPA: hypothetical protein VGY77_11735 [Gemmataceae bacterium]|nr:hypothetical protein [Gemmataceae bacterium]